MNTIQSLSPVNPIVSHDYAVDDLGQPSGIDVSIVLVTYNIKKFVLDCLTSIYQIPPTVRFEIVVVDNVSVDGTPDAIGSDFPQVHLIVNNNNVGLAAATNQALEVTKGRYILYLNPDTVISGETIEGMVRFADSVPDTSVFTCRLLNTDGTLQHSCFRFPSLRMAFYGFFPIVPMDSEENGRYPVEFYDRVFNPEHVLGAFLMVRRGVLEKIGGWDEEYFMYFEETDFCFRLHRSGYAALYIPEYSLIHHGGRSTSQVQEQMSVEFFRSQARYYRKNLGISQLVALKAIVLAGVGFWALRSSVALLRRRISLSLYKTRLAGYAQIALA